MLSGQCEADVGPVLDSAGQRRLKVGLVTLMTFFHFHGCLYVISQTEKPTQWVCGTILWQATVKGHFQFRGIANIKSICMQGKILIHKHHTFNNIPVGIP